MCNSQFCRCAGKPRGSGRSTAAKVLFAVVIAFASSCAFADSWPFIVIRHTGGINDSPADFRKIIDYHRLYPGACDEFWFAGGGRKKASALKDVFSRISSYRGLCEEVGIKVSYQQGVTLGHGVAHDGEPKPDEHVFPDDAWQVGRDGKKIGYVCPRSPEVHAYEREYCRILLTTLKPDSLWLDDDLRLGVYKENGCFCDRCIKAFNEKTGGSWTRESLARVLFSSKGRERTRKEWIEFNNESLSLFAAQARLVADELKSPCRLAYQAVWSDTVYTGPDNRAILEALSGASRRSVGIRPGATFYTEESPREMVWKCLSVAREAERCRGYPFPVSSVCYEMETYPRRVLHKSPGAIMTESALAIASGCSSVSLYWYSAASPEPLEEYGSFVKTLHRARPYFERLAASTKRTRLGGVARFVGSAAWEMPGFDLRDRADYHIASAGVPVTVAESGTGVFYLTEKSRGEMTSADKARLAGCAVVDVDGVGSFPLSSRRTKLLDDLDKATGGKFPVRIDACRAMRVLPRVDKDGKLDSVTVLNLSIGAIEDLRIRVRNVASLSPEIMDALGGRAEKAVLSKGAFDGEWVVEAGDVAPWSIFTVFFR